MERAREEVLNDFKNSLEKIDFENGYNPESKEYQQALNLGLMWLVMCKMAKTENKEPAEKKSDDIAEMLYLSKMFLQKFIDTADSSFKEMSETMLRYAGALIKKANAKLPTGEEKQKLKDYEVEMNGIAKQIEAV